LRPISLLLLIIWYLHSSGFIVKKQNKALKRTKKAKCFTYVSPEIKLINIRRGMNFFTTFAAEF